MDVSKNGVSLCSGQLELIHLSHLITGEYCSIAMAVHRDSPSYVQVLVTKPWRWLNTLLIHWSSHSEWWSVIVDDNGTCRPTISWTYHQEGCKHHTSNKKFQHGTNLFCVKTAIQNPDTNLVSQDDIHRKEYYTADLPKLCGDSQTRPTESLLTSELPQRWLWILEQPDMGQQHVSWLKPMNQWTCW